MLDKLALPSQEDIPYPSPFGINLTAVVWDANGVSKY